MPANTRKSPSKPAIKKSNSPKIAMASARAKVNNDARRGIRADAGALLV